MWVGVKKTRDDECFSASDCTVKDMVAWSDGQPANLHHLTIEFRGADLSQLCFRMRVIISRVRSYT